jgi:hypothetical protein
MRLLIALVRAEGGFMRSLLARMIATKNLLPDGMRHMFDALFVRGESDAQVAQDRGLSPEDFAKEKAAMMRSLMSGTSN